MMDLCERGQSNNNKNASTKHPSDIYFMSHKTYISERTSNRTTPSLRSTISSGGDPVNVGKVPRNSTMAVWRASSPIFARVFFLINILCYFLRLNWYLLCLYQDTVGLLLLARQCILYLERAGNVIVVLIGSQAKKVMLREV